MQRVTWTGLYWLRKIPTIEGDVRRCTMELGLDSSSTSNIQMTVIYERGNVPSGTIKYGEFRDWLNDS